MSFIGRYLTGFRGVDTDAPGLFEKDDGTSWYRKPDGTESEIGTGVGVFFKNNVDVWDLSATGPFNQIPISWPTWLDTTPPIGGQNPIDVLPDGIGFTLEDDTYFTFVEKGVWAYNFVIQNIPDDATLQGIYGLSGADLTDAQFTPGDQRNSIGAIGIQSVVQLPAGFQTEFFLEPYVAPTTSPCNASHASLAIIRIG